MINIYKNENDELECHVKYMGSDFKFQAIKTGMGVTFQGSNKPEYLEFENDDLGCEVLDKAQDIMSEILSISNWKDGIND